MTSGPMDWQERADQLAKEGAAVGAPPTAWFDQLYAAGRDGTVPMPWDRPTPSPLLVRWASEVEAHGAGRRAVVVGAGLGADAAFLAQLGYTTTAFDVSPTAVEVARERVTDPAVTFVTADLFALPEEWHHAFDLVVEIYTVQALPRSVRAGATAAVGELVAEGGTLLVIQASLGPDEDPDEGPPWPLTRTEIEAFAGDGLSPVRLEAEEDRGGRFAVRWISELTRA